MASIQVNTNGQTLKVNASVSHWTTAALAVTASASDDIPSTDTTTITANYTMHFANTATTAAITVSQLDGTTLLSQTFNVEPSTGPRVLNPLPDEYAQAADAGKLPYSQSFISGSYYFGSAQTNSTATALTVGHLRLAPVFIPSTLNIAKLGLSVTSAGASGSVCKLAIYSDNGAGYPGALFHGTGDVIDGTSATVQETTPDPVVPPLTRGLYWFGAVCQAQACTVRCGGAAMQVPGLHMTWGTTVPATGDTVGGYQQASVTAALPATFTTTPSPNIATAIPRVFFKTA